jgi:hairy and enhancer of split protein 1
MIKLTTVLYFVQTTHYSKLEKADILEMTVKYLRSLQRRQMTSAVAADPTVAVKYSMGFSECASEVARYLGNAQGINDDVRGRLLGHLSNCVQTGNSSQQVMNGQTYVQPLHVQIPRVQGNQLSRVHSEGLLIQPPAGFLTNSAPSSGTQVSGSFHVVPDSRYSEPAFLRQSQSMMDSISTRKSPLHKSPFSPPPCDLYQSPKTGLVPSPPFGSASMALKEERLWRPW